MKSLHWLTALQSAARRARGSRQETCSDVPPDLLLPIDWGHGPDNIHLRNAEGTLPSDVHAEAQRLADEGNAHMDAGAYVRALAAFRKGIEVLPPPRDRWEAAGWFLAGIGDALWYLGCHLNARRIWDDAILFGGGYGNPFAHLRRGQTLYELGDFEEAASELLRALLLGGVFIFRNDAPKYLDFIKSRARLPQGYSSWDEWTGAEPGSKMYDWLMGLDLYALFRAPEN